MAICSLRTAAPPSICPWVPCAPFCRHRLQVFMHSGFLICHSSPPRPMWPGPGWQGPGGGIQQDQRWWHLRWFKALLRFNKWLCPAVTMAVTSWHRWTNCGCLSPSSSSSFILSTSSPIPSPPFLFPALFLCLFSSSSSSLLCLTLSLPSVFSPPATTPLSSLPPFCKWRKQIVQSAQCNVSLPQLI